WHTVVALKQAPSSKRANNRRTPPTSSPAAASLETHQLTHASKLHAIPAGSWIVSSMDNCYSKLCLSTRRVSVRQLACLAGLQSAVIEGLSAARARVAASLRAVNGANVQGQPATMYKAIQAAKSAIRPAEEISTEYSALPSFLREFEHQNPGSRVCLQLDSLGRHYRTFVILDPLIQHQHLWQPIPQSMARTSRSQLHSSRARRRRTLCGSSRIARQRGSSWRASPCSAIVGTSDLRNKSWKRSVYLCSSSFACSISSSTAPTASILSTQIFATTRGWYASCRLLPLFGRTPREQTLEMYLRGIHPVLWTELGNYAHTPAEEEFLREGWGETRSYGRPMPLFGVKKTLANEGDNNGLLWSLCRGQHVPCALKLYHERAAASMQCKRKVCASWVEQGSTLPCFRRLSSIKKCRQWRRWKCTRSQRGSTRLSTGGADRPAH
ncbi:hypothetical protein PybrP1_007688, partial [[Pythium] brassicae (nom. inval.)]